MIAVAEQLPPPKLELVGVQLPEPPYPADVRARGWPFDLDLERIKQSSTWMRSPAEMRAHLFRLWAESWQQSPCGSLPSEDIDIAALIEMPVNLFSANKPTLLRGWVIHRDGRFYHRVITEMVWVMMGKRRRDAERIALIRKKSQGVATSRSESAAASASASASAKDVPPPPTLPTNWWKTDEGIIKVASLLGIKTKPGETYNELKGRCFAKAHGR